jgi:DNA repair protein RecO (recombination protein O)
MSIYNCRGIVLKELISGESNKTVVLLVKERGKIFAHARGARKQNSKFLSGTQLFSYSDFVIYDAGKFNNITQINLIDSFYKVSSDYEKLCYSNYFVEICEKTIQIGQPCDDILLLLLKCLQQLTKDIINPKLICVIYEFKFMKYSGYGIDIKNCSLCLNKVEQFNYIGNDGLLCNECSKKFANKTKISNDTIKALNYISKSEIENIFKFKVSDFVLNELVEINELLINHHLESKFNSKNFLNM